VKTVVDAGTPIGLFGGVACVLAAGGLTGIAALAAVLAFIISKKKGNKS
jgi:hypothetical protein